MHAFEPMPPAARPPAFGREAACPGQQDTLRGALAKVLRHAEKAEKTWACIAQKPPPLVDGLSSLKGLADLVDERIVAACNDREALILPLAAKVDRRRVKISAALEDRLAIASQNRQLLGSLQTLQKRTDAAEAERGVLLAAHETNQKSVDHLRDERGRLKQQVETLEEKSIGAHMVTSKLRDVLSEVSKRADEIEKQLSVAVSDSEWAVCHANCLEAQDANMRDEIEQLKSGIRLSREEAATAQHRLLDAQTISATDKEKSAEMEFALLAANGANEDLQAQLARALAANSSVSDRVDAVLADMDKHNRALGFAVEAAEVSMKRPPAMHILDDRPLVHAYSSPERDFPSQQQVVSISVRLGSPEEKAGGGDGRTNDTDRISTADPKSTARTPKAALRKRLLDARQALGGVKLGDAPKRSISFHPQFASGVCDDDLV